MTYEQFQEIWPELFQLFEQNPNIYPPDSSVGIKTHWKRHTNFTNSKIYGKDGEVIGTENCHFILPCDKSGTPIEPRTIILKEWRDIRQHLQPTSH